MSLPKFLLILYFLKSFNISNENEVKEAKKDWNAIPEWEKKIKSKAFYTKLDGKL